MTESYGDYQIELGKLLQKERSDSARMEVDQILSDSLTIQDKIIKIKALDHAAPIKPSTIPSEKEGEEETVFKEQPEESKAEKTAYISRKDLELVDEKPISAEEGMTDDSAAVQSRQPFKEVEKARRTLKVPKVRSTFFQYLFKELKKLRVFGRQSGIVSNSFLSVNVRLNSELATSCSRNIQKRVALPLLTYLTKVLEFSWEILKKQEYNDLALLRKLCRVVMNVNFNMLNFRDKNLIDRLRLLEILFLSCYAEKDYISRVSHSLQKIQETYADFSNKDVDIVLLARKLLSPNGTRPSLYNFLLGANMVKYRQFLTYDDLIQTGSVTLVSTTDFDCSPEIYKKIQNRIQALEKEMQPLLGVKLQIEKTRSFIPSDDMGSYDFSLLKYFYDYFKDSPTFDIDCQKMNVFIPQFIKFFYAQVRLLLDEPLEVEEFGQPVRVFETFFFRSDWDRLQLLVKKMEKIEMSLTSFPQDRYYKLLDSSKGGISIELEMMSVTKSILDMVYRLSELLVAVIQQRLETSDDIESPPPITRAAYQQGTFFIPFEHRRIVKNDFFEGKTVLDSLVLIAQLGYLFGLYLKDNNLMEMLKKENRLKQKVIFYTKSFKRLASIDQFMIIKNKYNLPNV